MFLLLERGPWLFGLTPERHQFVNACSVLYQRCAHQRGCGEQSKQSEAESHKLMDCSVHRWRYLMPLTACHCAEVSTGKTMPRVCISACKRSIASGIGVPGR